MKTRKQKIVIGCVSAVAVAILAVVLFALFVMWHATRPLRQAVRYIQNMSEADMRQWVDRTETLLTNENAQATYDGLPKGMREPITKYFINDDTIIYHWCAGFACVDFRVARLPEGGHELVCRDIRFTVNVSQ